MNTYRATEPIVGADVSIEISGSCRARHEAIRATAYNSRVVVAGFLRGEAAGLALGESSTTTASSSCAHRSPGSAPTPDHRCDPARVERAVVDLAAVGRLGVVPLITHTLPLAEAAAASALLTGSPADAVQLVLDFDDGPR